MRFCLLVLVTALLALNLWLLRHPGRSSPAGAPAAIPLGAAREVVNPRDGQTLVLVPGGAFLMGAEGTASEEDERPAHTVEVEAFYIGKTEVTNAMFRRFTRETGYVTTAEKQGWAFVWTGGRPSPEGPWERRKGASWRTLAAEWGEEAPVAAVSWYDAQAYCRWAGLRLPTEAEWEKAARGTDGRRYPWGNRWDPDRAWFGDNSGGRAHPVGSRPQGASPFGALDMAGNLWEWTSSLYWPYPYRADDGREDPSASGWRVLRGGTWVYTAWQCRTSQRYRYTPETCFDIAGFRCAASVADRFRRSPAAP